MAITFEVSRVARATTLLRMPAKTAAQRLHGEPVEAMGANVPVFLPSDGHGLIRAVHTAYALHYPLALSPDAIWLAIAQGFAAHRNANAERLRGRLVRHDGRATIAVRRDDFVKGSPDNPWPQAFSVFSEAVAGYIGRQRDLLVCDFSTTGPYERAASEVVLLDAMKSYFIYEVHTLCGIPEVTLDGTIDDWRAIRRRARALGEYELAWWTDALEPVLDELVATAEGRVDLAFWKTFFKHEDASGGAVVRGWINVLFPYVRQEAPGDGLQGGTLARNDAMAAWKNEFDARRGRGSTCSKIPSGLSCVPFEWRHLGDVFPMEFLGGFVGVAQDADTLAVRPAIGWAVCDAAGPAAPVHEDVEGWAREPRLSPEVTLIAGRITNPVSLTIDEVIALRGRIERCGEAAGAHLALVPAGNTETLEQFPEHPITLRLVVGVPIGSVGRRSSRDFDVAELRGALRAVRTISEATWRAIAALVPGELGGASALYLAVAGERLSGTLRLGERRSSIGVEEVTTTGTATADIDISAAAHDARVESVRECGVAPDSARYSLGTIWEPRRPPAP